jgi:endonuclease/exonuclease/phosphatase family metal-dependent hydrolase
VVDPIHYQMSEAQWFTFPSLNPDRRLDYIYYSSPWNLLNTQIVHPSRPQVSDHLPVSASFKLFNPEFIRD